MPARIILQYANTMRQTALVAPPGELRTLFGQVADRIILQYANTSRQMTLAYPLALINDTVPPQIRDVQAQNVPEGVKITWTTDEFATSEVRYGTAPGAYTQTAADPLFARTHELTLTGLLAGQVVLLHRPGRRSQRERGDQRGVHDPADGHGDPHAHAEPHPHRHTDSDAHPDGHGHPHRHSDAEPDADTHHHAHPVGDAARPVRLPAAGAQDSAATYADADGASKRLPALRTERLPLDRVGAVGERAERSRPRCAAATRTTTSTWTWRARRPSCST